MSSIYHTIDDRQPSRPPRWWIGYTVAALCLVLGIVLPCGGIYGLMISDQDKGPSFQPPGSVAVPVAKPGRMVVWIDEPDESSTRARLETPDDARCTVMGPDGQPLASREAAAGTSSTTMTSSRIGAFVFDANAAGSYAVAVTGTFPPDQSIIVTPDRGDKDNAYAIAFLGLLIVGGLLVLAGIATLIVTIVKHSRHPG